MSPACPDGGLRSGAPRVYLHPAEERTAAGQDTRALTLDIIGAGFGRTGTSSLRAALEALGYPCYHMSDLLFRPERKPDVAFWHEVAEAPDAAHDWDRVFGHVRATVDFPGCAVWRRLAHDHPAAKVILTLHPGGAGAWYDSCRKTIYVGTGLDAATAFGRTFNAMMDRLVWNGLLQGTMEDRSAAIARYEAHAAEVRDTVPADRLLVFAADQGWDPLCAFLGQPVPDLPFPKANDREAMSRTMDRVKRFALRNKAAQSGTEPGEGQT